MYQEWYERRGRLLTVLRLNMTFSFMVNRLSTYPETISTSTFVVQQSPYYI